MGSISSYNIAGLISEVSEEVATQIAKNCRHQQPHSHLRSLPRGTPANIHIYPIFPGTSHWPTFLSLHVWVYLHSNLYSELKKAHLFCTREHQSAFWPFKVIQVDDFGNNRKRVCDFLLVAVVGHCDYGPILHRFWDTAIYWLKIAYFSYPTLIRRPRSLCSLWNFGVKLTMRKLESWGYSRVKTGWS